MKDLFRFYAPNSARECGTPVGEWETVNCAGSCTAEGMGTRTMAHSQGPPQNLLYFGVFLLILGVVYTWIEKVWTRSRWVFRADEPKRYWSEVALYYVGGGVLIGYSCT